MSFRIDPRANGDVTDAVSWFIQYQRYTVAGRLWRYWLEALDKIEANPQRYPPADDAPTGREVRNYILPRYGYRVVYEVAGPDVTIVALSHGRRRGRHWLPRLDPQD